MTKRQETAVNHPRLLTVSRPDLLVDGSDAKLRNVIHRLHSHGQVMEKLAGGFGRLYGVSGVQHQIMTAVQRLQGTEGVAVVDVAEYIRRSGAFVTIESGKLVASDLLEKMSDATDGRRVLLRLTREGHKRLADLAPVQRRINDMLFASLDRDRFLQLAMLLEDLLPNAEHAADMLELINKDRKRTSLRSGLQGGGHKKAAGQE
jgi:DNA-binding MarR family transcriptional regulator